MPSKSWKTRRKVNKNSTQAEKNPAVVDPNKPQHEITKTKMTKRQTKRDQSKEMFFLLLK